MEFQPTLQTIIFLSLFVCVYLFILLRNTIKDAIDFYDFLLLSSVAVIPLFYILTPDFVTFLARLIGVSFSFLILFGSLLVIAFIYSYRLTLKFNAQNKKIVLLIQEIGLLREALVQQKKKKPMTEQESEN